MSGRSYRQIARAEATEQTRLAIIRAAIDLFYAGEYEAGLGQIADEAGVTTRTILRHFGSKNGLIEAAIADQAEAVQAERAAAPGDAESFVHALVDHYETHGERVLRTLAAEDRYPVVRRVTEDGRRLHAEMVERAFEPDLERLLPQKRAAKLALLVAVTDVYTWALLRLRGGLDRNSTETELLGLVNHARGDDG